MRPLGLSIVTSCRNYGAYLEDWANSIIALQGVRPREVVIVQNGSDDATPAQAIHAAGLLRAAGFPVILRHVARTDFGSARNLAVSLSSSEWVMHLDADDMLMPHALQDVEQLAPEADVVCMGYERCGDLKAGPMQRVKLYRTSIGRQVLSNPTPASGVSPFRRQFWEQAPYSTTLHGGWDTALWLGFGHLGARFIPTRRPGFWYRQHADSVFNTRRRSGWPASRTGHQLESRRRGDRGVSVLVPRAADLGGPRDRSWAWLRQRYATLFPDWQLVEGRCARSAWSKGEAVAHALSKAQGNTLVIADSDCYMPRQALLEAVRLVETGGAAWAMPHGLVHRLEPEATKSWLDRAPGEEYPPDGPYSREPYLGVLGGGILVVPRAAFQATGGIPQAFVGWGAEDEALAVILNTLLGPVTRLKYPLTHFWHPPQDNRKASSSLNRAILQRLRAAATRPDLLWTLLQETRGLRGSAAIARMDRTMRTAALARQQTEAPVERMSFRDRALAAQRERTIAAAAEGKMLDGGAENKMLAGAENKANRVPVGGKKFTREALELAQRHKLTPADFSEVPGATIGLAAVNRLLAYRASREQSA